MAGNPGVIPGFPDQLIPGSNPLLPGSTPLLPGLEELARNPADFHQVHGNSNLQIKIKKSDFDQFLEKKV